MFFRVSSISNFNGMIFSVLFSSSSFISGNVLLSVSEHDEINNKMNKTLSRFFIMAFSLVC